MYSFFIAKVQQKNNPYSSGKQCTELLYCRFLLQTKQPQ